MDRHFRPTSLCFASTCLVIIGLYNAVSGLLCFDCTRTPYPSDCPHLVQCDRNNGLVYKSDKELFGGARMIVLNVCSIEEVITDSGVVLFNVGCRDKSRCRRHKRQEKEQRDVFGDMVVCENCCYDDFCNSRGCGAILPSPTFNRGPLCFNCPEYDRFCDTITLCRADQTCNTLITQANIIGRRGAGTLSMQSNLFGYRDKTTCTVCCHRDFCNRDCKTASSPSTTAMPAFTTATTRSTTAMPAFTTATTRSTTAMPSFTTATIRSTTTTTAATIPSSPVTSTAAISSTASISSTAAITSKTDAASTRLMYTDKPGVDCAVLQNFMQICNDRVSAAAYCPAYCTV